MKTLLFLVLPVAASASQDVDPQKMMGARFHLNSVFDKNMDAKVPVADRGLPESAAARGYPLNVDPEIVTADQVDFGDEDIVMGIVINGEARAYPVNYMNGPYNEVVNDELGGQAIAPSW